MARYISDANNQFIITASRLHGQYVNHDDNLKKYLNAQCQASENIKRYTCIPNASYNCDYNAFMVILDSISSTHKYQELLNEVSLDSKEDKATIKSYFDFLHMQISEDRDKLIQAEEQELCKKAMSIMHINKLYCSGALTLTWSNTLLKNKQGIQIDYKHAEIKRWLKFIQFNSLKENNSIIHDQGVCINLNYFINMIKKFNLSRLDLQIVDLSMFSVKIKDYGQLVINPKYSNYLAQTKHRLEVDICTNLRQYDEYVKFVRSQILLAAKACAANFLIVAITSASITMDRSAACQQHGEIMTKIVAGKKLYLLHAFGIAPNFCRDGYSHSCAGQIKEDGSLVYIDDMYKFVIKNGLKNEVSSYLLFGANLLVYKREKIM